MNKDLSFTETVELEANQETVWDAVTNPEMVRKYFFGTELETEWQVGGPILFRGEWEGKSYEDRGTILDYEPQKRYSFDYWSSFSGEEDTEENRAIITYELQPKGKKTLLSITQKGAKSDEDLEHSRQNWKMILGELQKLLEKK